MNIKTLEQRIEQRKLQEEYAAALLETVCGDEAYALNSVIEVDPHHGWDGHRLVIALSQMTEQQHVDAALRTLDRPVEVNG